MAVAAAPYRVESILSNDESWGMQEIPAGVEAVIEAVNQELRFKPQLVEAG